jgi:hypothetical protein
MTAALRFSETQWMLALAVAAVRPGSDINSRQRLMPRRDKAVPIAVQ